MNTENDVAQPPVPAGNPGNNVLKIVLPLLLVVGLILLGVFVVPKLMGSPQKAVTSENAEAVFTELDEHLTGLTESLNAVSDVDSASALKSKFESATKFIGSLNLKGLDEKMTSKIKGRMGNIRALGDALKAAYGVDGARDVIRPMFDAMLEKIDKQLGRDKI